MNIIETKLPGLFIIDPKVYEDASRYFYESYSKLKMFEKGLSAEFVQDNQSKSSYGVVRGLHYQLCPHAQTKLVRVVEGIILDVAVDIRKASPTFGKYFSIELSSDNKKQLYVPKGFAHGFSVLSNTAVVFYKCDYNYTPLAEAGIRYNDQSLNIDWKLDLSKVIVSQKDSILPLLKDAVSNFSF
jgi:dTDP-4-dehydrorhamnose 3,5-epimerase